MSTVWCPSHVSSDSTASLRLCHRCLTGVCDGNDASGIQAVTLIASTGSTYTQSQLDDPLSDARLALDTAVSSAISSRLNRPADSIDVVDVTFIGRRRAEIEATTATAVAAAAATAASSATPAATARRRLQASSLSINTALLPFGGSNNLQLAQLSALLTNASASPSTGAAFAIQAVPAVSLRAVCGNGVCESGERPNAGTGTVGCPDDCPYPVLSCPAVNGYVCNNAGACVASSFVTASGYNGRCACQTAQGYAGDACELCQPGFATASTTTGGVVLSVCRRLEVQSRAVPTADVPSSAGGLGVYLWVIIGGGAGVCVLLVVLAALCYRRVSQARRWAAYVRSAKWKEEHGPLSPQSQVVIQGTGISGTWVTPPTLDAEPITGTALEPQAAHVAFTVCLSLFCWLVGWVVE